MQKELVESTGQIILYQPSANNVAAMPILPSVAEGTENIVQPYVITNSTHGTLLQLCQQVWKNMQ